MAKTRKSKKKAGYNKWLNVAHTAQGAGAGAQLGAIPMLATLKGGLTRKKLAIAGATSLAGAVGGGIAGHKISKKLNIKYRKEKAAGRMKGGRDRKYRYGAALTAGGIPGVAGHAIYRKASGKKL